MALNIRIHGFTSGIYNQNSLLQWQNSRGWESITVNSVPAVWNTADIIVWQSSGVQTRDRESQIIFRCLLMHKK